jgi:tRNA (guanine-N7-)-methyltransferase
MPDNIRHFCKRGQENSDMRMRTKPWAKPELAVCDYYIKEPKTRKNEWQDFFAKKQPLYLDLGCGKCTFLAKIAHMHPEINFLGIDISYDILGVGRRNISAEYKDDPVNNVGICYFNIEKLTEITGPDDNVERIYINFCNPWQKSGCHKRRLTHTRQLLEYRKILSPDGEIWFKTDNDDLFLSSQRYFREAGFEIYSITHDLMSENDPENVLSEHEIKFEAMGIKTKALKARMLPSDASYSLKSLSV